MRGTEARSIAKWQKGGWELVDQSAGTLHSTLNFRSRKPPKPVRHMLMAGGVALVLAGIIGVGALLKGDGDGAESLSTQPTAGATQPPDSPSNMPTPADSPLPEPTAVATEQSDGPPTDVTVDGLLDKLNSANMGGIRLGDRFRLTGELVASEYWGTGASGDFFVLLKAKGGADDLQVFVDEADADGWQNGTRVEMVVESVEVTTNGETTDGWLRVRSVKTVPGA